ncbi:MAG TPA: flagellar basal body-associated FliL family protein [Deltaproteobacteria bacterium]|nr:flagellar basal body-associated FliL family protein [Deltaproteobacteria bacterium]
MADEEGDEIESSGGGSVVKLAAVGLVGFLLGGGAGFGGSMMLAGEPECDEVAEEGEGEEGEEVAERAVHSLDSFTVNLRGTGGGRVLRMVVQVEVESDQVALVEEQTPLLRDAVLTLASDYTYADLEGLDGKMRFRDELMSRLNGALATPSVRRVYFTQFVVQ